MAITTKEVGRKSPGDTAAVAMDFTPLLRSGELLTGTPTVAEVTTTDLTIANVGLNSSTIEVNGASVAANGAVQCTVAGGTAATKYTVRITCGTDTSPAQTLVRDGTFFVE